MLRVAEDIRRRSEGKLHILVATHRHKDHISGFATNAAGDAPGDIIRQCEPDVIIQPWTEDPDAQPDATHATARLSRQNRAFAASLLNMQFTSAAVKAEAAHLRLGLSKRVADELAFLGEDNLSNRSAIENLIRMGKRRGARTLYVNYDFDRPLKLESLLPGVRVRVLGPPNLEQSQAITKQRSSDPNEFWQLQARAGLSATLGESPLFPSAPSESASHLTPAYTRWFIRRMHRTRGSQLLQIVRILDSVMNNTSVILLFEAGRKKLLFPGDAQIENWSYALSKPEVTEMLAGVDVYKVGHHGSRNANPKTLWQLFDKKNPKKSPARLRTFVSTMEGKHGDPDRKTEVPRESLVEALKLLSDYFTTQDLQGENALSEAFTINL